MIPARLAPVLRPLLGSVVVVVAAACASSGEAPASWPELGGEAGGGGRGGDTGPASGATSSTASTSSAGGAAGSSTGEGGAAGSSTGEGGAAGSSTGEGGAPCGDTGPGEPNDEEATATFLYDITDCDETGGTVSGVLTTADDVDWYRYTATDEFLCSVDPSRSFSPSGRARLCKFAQCTQGGTAGVTCGRGATPATSPAGRPGCCHTQGFSMEVDCSGADDDTSIYLRIDQPALSCAPYTIVFHY